MSFVSPAVQGLKRRGTTIVSYFHYSTVFDAPLDEVCCHRVVRQALGGVAYNPELVGVGAPAYFDARGWENPNRRSDCHRIGVQY